MTQSSWSWLMEQGGDDRRNLPEHGRKHRRDGKYGRKLRDGVEYLFGFGQDERRGAAKVREIGKYHRAASDKPLVGKSGFANAAAQQLRLAQFRAGEFSQRGCPAVDIGERLWLYLRENRLTHCVFQTTEQIIDTCCDAWNWLLAETGRIRSLCSYPWLEQVNV
jgi:hypothetical protein